MGGGILGYGYGYALNSEIAGANRAKVPHQETVILHFESNDLERSACSTIKTLAAPPRHQGSNNVVYLDGHAKAIKKLPTPQWSIRAATRSPRLPGVCGATVCPEL